MYPIDWNEGGHPAMPKSLRSPQANFALEKKINLIKEKDSVFFQGEVSYGEGEQDKSNLETLILFLSFSDTQV